MTRRYQLARGHMPLVMNALDLIYRFEAQRLTPTRNLESQAHAALPEHTSALPSQDVRRLARS
jgi:hypothetical protein